MDTDFEAGFDSIFTTVVKLFQLIYSEGLILWEFFSTALVDTSPEIAELLPEFANYTPFDLMFGLGLIGVLVFGLIKFFIGIF